MQCPGDVGRLHYRRPGNLWNFWTVNYSCLIDLSDDVHHHVRCACMYVRTEYTHTYIYIITCIALHDFTIFYTHLSLYSTYIYSMSFTISTGHQRLRALRGLEPSIARLLRGAVDGTNSWGFQFFFLWEIIGIFYGNIYIYMYICIYPYEIIYSMYICIMKWLFNVFNVFMGLNDHINICICLIIWLCMYICNVIWDISCFMYIWLYMICIPGYYLKICNMSLGYVTVRIHSAALGHLCRGDEPCTEMRWIWSHRTAQTVADSLEKYGESAF